jgi:hypothetical protein
MGGEEYTRGTLLLAERAAGGWELTVTERRLLP